MNTADRRAEIINILLVRRRITAKELKNEARPVETKLK